MPDNPNTISDEELLKIGREAVQEIAEEEKSNPPSARRDMAEYYELGMDEEEALGQAEVADLAVKTSTGLRAMALGDFGDISDDPRVDMEMSDVFMDVAMLAENNAPDLGEPGEIAEAWAAENPGKAVAAAELGEALLEGVPDEMTPRADMAMPGYDGVRSAFNGSRNRVQNAFRKPPGVAADAGATGYGYTGEFNGEDNANMMNNRADMNPLRNLNQRYRQWALANPAARKRLRTASEFGGAVGIGGAGLLGYNQWRNRDNDSEEDIDMMDNRMDMNPLSRFGRRAWRGKRLPGPTLDDAGIYSGGLSGAARGARGNIAAHPYLYGAGAGAAGLGAAGYGAYQYFGDDEYDDPRMDMMDDRMDMAPPGVDAALSLIHI